MNADFPAMKASYLKDSVAALSGFGPEKEAAVRALVPEGLLEQIQAATKVDWLPIDLDVHFTDALYRVLGEQGLRKLACDAMVRSTQGPLTGPFVRGTIKLFGLSPKHLLKLSKQFWRAVYRNCGRIEPVDVGLGTLDLHFHDLPEIVARSRAYLIGFLGGIDGVLVLTKAQEGEVALAPGPQSPGLVTIRVRWSAGKP